MGYLSSHKSSNQLHSPCPTFNHTSIICHFHNISPPLHHRSSLLKIVTAVIRTTNLILVHMSKCRLNNKPSSFRAVLAIERSPCETSTPPKPARISDALTVWLFIGWFGLIRLGKINSRFPLNGFIISSTANASSDKGTVWSRFIFIREARIFHSALPNQLHPTEPQLLLQGG